MRLFSAAIIVMMCGALLAGCMSSSSEEAATNAPDSTAAVSDAEASSDRYAHIEGTGTAKMVGVLEAINEEARENPMDYFHLNHLRAEQIRQDMEQAPPEEKIRLQHAYAHELLYAGEAKAAIEELTALIDKIGPQMRGITRQTKPIYDLLGLAYMQLGEQQNCHDNPSAQSCILPITGAGLHTDPTGAKNAIEVYSRILRRFRTDLQSRWLLNVAYMTLGEYPEGVPSRWRIDGLNAEGNAPVNSFRNVAMGLDVDHNAIAGGVSVEDFNNDGFLDIFVTSYGLDDQAKLYINDGEGGFVDRTEEAGLTGLVGGLNVVHADYNNDGYEDLFILRGAWLGQAGEHPNSLLRNNGDGTFTDVTYEAGLASYHPTQVAAWGDFNRDGWIDLFVGNESNVEIDYLTGQQAEGTTPSHPSALYLNNGDGTFTNVADQVGLDLDAFVKGADWGDVSGDGRPDLYVSILGGPNRLYVNQGGDSVDDWAFEERAEALGLTDPFFSFPVWFWDYNNDGHDDLFVADYDMRYLQRVARAVAAEFMNVEINPRAERSHLYRNNGDGTFTEVSAEAGVDNALFGMGANYGDLDNDGYQDFYVGTGAPDLRSIVPNRMFHNQGGGRFSDISFESGFAHIQKGHGVGFGDFDRDGDQDIYMVIGGAVEGDNFRNALFENPGHGHHWITLDLEGTSSNRSAIGAEIELVVSGGQAGERTIHRTVSTGGSFGASALQQEIGLGDATRIERLTITWPNAERMTQTFTDLAVDQVLKIVEGEEPVSVDRPSVPLKTRPDAASPDAASESTASR